MRIWDIMMTGAVAAGALLLAAESWAQTEGQAADGTAGDRLVVPLPDISGLSDEEAESLTRQLAEMDVITANCPDYDVTDGEWTLMTGTSDALTQRLGLDPLEFDRDYFRPAHRLLDDPAACDQLGPQAEELIGRLVAMGGGTAPVTPAADPAAGETPSETEAETDPETDAETAPVAE